jgi:hypothetical protein
MYLDAGNKTRADIQLGWMGELALCVCGSSNLRFNELWIESIFRTLCLSILDMYRLSLVIIL